MASLESLPAPYPLHIIKQLPDLKSLDALRSASPLFATVFDIHAADIFEHLLQETLLEDIALQLRACALLLLDPSQKPQDETSIQTLYERARSPLPKETPASVFRQCLRIFSSSHSLGDTILRDKLDHLLSLPHQHLQDPRFLYHRGRQMNYQPTGTPYTIRSLSPPRWAEEYRMIRAMLRLRVFAALDSAPAFLKTIKSDWQRDEFDEALSATALLRQEDHSKAEAITSDRNPTASMTWHAPATMPWTHSPLSATDIAWGHDRETSLWRARHGTRGHGFFHAACRAWPYSPLHDADWLVLRRLGLGFWDEQRMAQELELDNCPQGVKPLRDGVPYYIGGEDYLSGSNCLFTWQALYHAEVSAAMEDVR